MKARMEKYETNNIVKARTTRNENLYSEVQNMNIDYVNINVNNAVDLSTTKTKTSREDYQKQRELNKIIPQEKEKRKTVNSVQPESEERVYDINEILKMARQNKLFEEKEKKRLINTEYNILTKLDVASLEQDNIKKEDLRSLIDDIYGKEKPKKEKKQKSEEQLLENLLYDPENEDDMKIDENINISQSINEEKIEKETVNEIEKKEIKNENKVINDEEDDYLDIGEGKGLTIAIIIVVILILLTCAFFVYEYFFGI